ncbi:hypothetical protein [Novosphingobium sp. FSW06-99]|uniref:hypothetical protein n=1 Tax=Novosphingobium sp. FSW06-99 TaxID=1739113 RepID=UPI00076DEFB0|nr:hypothetical protein [Novosphingobium sp. FSW06-99]KUR80787.1 hypothetical protein AQZ49_01800 [Novosphingobium sp. FSW06-99]
MAAAQPECLDDLRQGVTFTQHAALDLLEQRGRIWAETNTDTLIEMARICAFDARNSESASFKHGRLIHAAALMLAAAERVAIEACRG